MDKKVFQQDKKRKANTGHKYSVTQDNDAAAKSSALSTPDSDLDNTASTVVNRPMPVVVRKKQKRKSNK